MPESWATRKISNSGNCNTSDARLFCFMSFYILSRLFSDSIFPLTFSTGTDPLYAYLWSIHVFLTSVLSFFWGSGRSRHCRGNYSIIGFNIVYRYQLWTFCLRHHHYRLSQKITSIFLRFSWTCFLSSSCFKNWWFFFLSLKPVILANLKCSFFLVKFLSIIFHQHIKFGGIISIFQLSLYVDFLLSWKVYWWVLRSFVKLLLNCLSVS